MTTRWRIAPGADPTLRDWGGDFVVHHGLSNDTHRVSARAGSLLLRLSSGVGGAEDSGAAIDDDEVLATLDALSELGFVTRC